MNPSYRNRAELEHLVVSQRARGRSIRKLSAMLQISRNLVRRILRKHDQERTQGHQLLVPKQPTPRVTKLDDYVVIMERLFVEFPDIRGTRMLEELQREGYQGGITQVRDRMHKLRPQPKRRPVVSFSTDPGQQGQFDWSPYTIKLKNGTTLKVLCFSYVLGFSRRQFIDFTPRRDFHTLIRRHVDAFTYFGGVPKECLYDGEKTVILRWEARQPIFNPAFLSFITHYDCRPVGCGPRRPELKGKVEQPFKYVDSSLLNARKFHDFEDLRSTARWWMANRSDVHKHDTTGRPPLELFLEQELGALLPLPRCPYDTGDVGFRICRFDGFVEWQTNQYSVDYAHIGDILAVKATEHEIWVYGPDLHVVARHQRKPDGARAKEELPEHRRDKKVRYGLEPTRETFEGLGSGAPAFLAGLAERHPRNGGFHARRILLLREHYHSDDIHRALEHAQRYQAFDCVAVERIVRARYRPRTLEETVKHKASEQLRAVLPRIAQRPLADYQRHLQPTTHCPKEPDDETTHGIEDDTARDDTGDR